jgi:hypothetical protein
MKSRNSAKRASTPVQPAKPVKAQSTQSKAYVAPPKPQGGPGAKLDPIVRLPVAGGRVSQQFGNVPKNQSISYQSKTNLGTDIAAPTGSGIESIVGGKVIAINPNAGAWGNQIVVDAGNGRQLSYNHLSDFGDFTVGQEVKAGETLGQVGSTGQTTGPHLDLEATVNGASVPLSTAFPGSRFDKAWGGAEKGVAGAKAYNRAQNAFYDTSDLTKSTGSVYASGSGEGVGTSTPRSTSFSSGVSNASASGTGFGNTGQQVNLGALNQVSMRRPRSTRVSSTTPTLLAPASVTPTQTSNPGTVTTSKSL